MTTENATRPAADTAAVPVITCRLCGSTELRSFLDLGATPPCELFLTAAAVEAPEPTYPLHVRVCERLPARPDPAADHARGDVHRVRLLLLVLRRPGWSTPAGSSTARSSGSASPRTPSWSRWPATTATCCSTSSSAASGAWASSRRSTSARPPGTRACPRSPRSSPRRPAGGARAARPGRPGLPQQRLRPHPRRGRLHRGPARDGRRRRLGVDRGAAPADAGGAHPVRHRLPRALPVLHAAHRPAGARHRRPDARRRRAAAHPRRLHPHVGAAQRDRGRAEPGRARRARRRGRRRACTPPRATTGSPRPSPACATTSSRSSSRRAGRARRWSGYGAPGKGNTLLNYCGIRPDLLDYTVDRNPYKHGRFTPGTRIPILPPERIAQDRPDYVLILPWNLRDELTAQLSYVREWGGKLVFPIPHLEVV